MKVPTFRPFMPSWRNRDKAFSQIRKLAGVFSVAVVLNYPWERAQAQLYVRPNETSIPWWLCVVASLCDGLLVLLIAVIGWMLLGQPDWFQKPGTRGYLVMLASGAMITVGVEWTTIYLMHWWTYSERMPLVPGLRVGLLPQV